MPMYIGRSSQGKSFPAINTLTSIESCEAGPSLTWNLMFHISSDKDV